MIDGPQSTGGGEDFDDLGAAPTLPASEKSRKAQGKSPGGRMASLRRPSRKMALGIAVIVIVARARRDPPESAEEDATEHGRHQLRRRPLRGGALPAHRQAR